MTDLGKAFYAALTEARREAEMRWRRTPGISGRQAESLAQATTIKCSDCGQPVNVRKGRAANIERRPDGVFAHVQCSGYRADKKEAGQRQRRYHRDTVRLAVTRDGAIR